MFGVDYVDDLLARGRALGLSGEDLVATATALTAESIAAAVREYVMPRTRPARLILGGGGSYNPTLVSFVRRALEPLGIRVQTQEELGHSSDAKEAVAFALLADCTLRGVPSAMPSVTGARYPAVLGKLSFPGGVE